MKNRLKKLRQKGAKQVKQVKDLVPAPGEVIEKAAGLNPLNQKPPEPVVPSDVPQITNETIAEHREDVLSGARKYIYPLQHSKHRIVVITAFLVTTTIVALFVYFIIFFN